MKIQEKYNDDEFQALAEILGKLTVLFAESPDDYLGSIYTKLGLIDKNKKRHIISYGAAKCGASIMFSKQYMEQQINNVGHILVNEPSISSGVSIIALSSLLDLYGFIPSKHLIIKGNDNDMNFIYMAYIQLSLLGINATLTYSDEKSNDTLSIWKTPSHYLDLV